VPHGWPTTEEGWRDLGRQLATVHTGVTSAADPDGHLDDPDRWHRCEEVLDDSAIEDGDLRHELARELQQLEPVLADGWPKRFVHDDVQGPNLLFDVGTDEVWLIDWGDAGWADAALDFRRIDPAATPLVLEGYRQVAVTDDGFEARVRWDQLGAAARRVAEPEYGERLRRMLRS
jgi:aminoglycoside phosphotransferase (APT) family kinase protein